MSMNHFKILSEKPAATIISASMIERRMDAGCFQPTYLKNESNLLNGRVPYARLGSLYKKGNYGSLPDSVDYASDGIALIRGTDLQSMSVNLSEAVRVPEYYYDQFKKAQIKTGDILMLVKGASIDRSDSVAMFPETDDKAIANGSVFIIRVNEKTVSSKYLLAVMTSGAFLLQKRRGSSNTGALYNDLDTIKAFIVPLPDSRIQAFIGCKVTLAEKCREEANKLHRKINEKVDEFLSQLGIPKIQDKETDQLTFFAESDELTNIRLDPKYYRPRFIFTVKNLTSVKHDFLENIITNCNYGASVPSDYVDEGIPFIRGVDLVENRILSGDMCYLSSQLSNKVKRSRVNKNDILITRSGSVGTTSVVTENHDGYAFGSYMIRFSVNSNYNPFYIASFLNSSYGKSQTERLRNGAVQENINLEEIGRIVIPWISREAQDEVERLVRLWIDFSEKSIGFNTEAKSDVEALIEGKLNTDAILSGKIKAPTWEDIEKELEGI